MEKILPVAGATGSRSFAATEADPPSLTVDQDQESDHGPFRASPGNDLMDIDSTGQPSIHTSIPTSSAIKRPRSDPPTESGSVAALSIPSDHSKKSKKSTSDKGKKIRTSGYSASAHSVNPSTSQRVDKVTPAVAIVELHGSIKDMTQAIMVASKPPESAEDRAAVRCQEAVRLVQERKDGLLVKQMADLIVFFSSHSKEVDMYIALEETELRQAVIRQWIGDIGQN